MLPDVVASNMTGEEETLQVNTDDKDLISTRETGFELKQELPPTAAELENTHEDEYNRMNL